MKINNDAITTHDREAADYDASVESWGWRGHEILFGICDDLIETGMDLLDLGTGTGVAALPFHRRGLRTFGLDGSPGMLKCASSKGFMKGMARHDLTKFLPFSDRAFDMVLACGLLLFLSELDPLFDEVARILKPGGSLAFTARVPDSRQPGAESSGGLIVMKKTEGVNVYIHSKQYLEATLKERGFETIKTVDFLCEGDYRADLSGFHHARLAVKG